MLDRLSIKVSFQAEEWKKVVAINTQLWCVCRCFKTNEKEKKNSGIFIFVKDDDEEEEMQSISTLLNDCSVNKSYVKRMTCNSHKRNEMRREDMQN